MGGKGGVGKTTIAVNLAYALSKKGFRVGLLDVDIHGPNVPKMLNLEDRELMSKENKIMPVKFSDNLSVVSMAFLLKRTDAVIWRGPMKHNVIKQFLEGVMWSNLDYLVIDFPPGTGDEAISVSQLLKDITGSIIVASPQKVALLDTVKAIDFSKKVNIPIMGLIENMSGEIFGEGGVEDTAKETNIQFLGRLGLDAGIRESGDKGIPFVISNPMHFNTIVEKIVNLCEKR